MLKNQNRRLGLIVLVSISLHVALFTTLYMSKPKAIVSLEKPPIIQAELLFVDTATFLPAEESLQQVDELPLIEKAAEVPINTPKDTSPAKAPPSEYDNFPPPEAEQIKEGVEEEITPPETSVPEEETDSVAVAESLPTLESTEKPKNIFQQPLQDVAKSQVNAYQQSKLNSLAAQAAIEYRQQRNHPKIGAAESDSFLTEEEMFEQKITTTVDCSSASKATLATVLGYMGGRVKCSEPPPFDAFIQKRLNKTAELPAMQNQDKKQQ